MCGTNLGLVYKSRDTVVLDVATRASLPGPQLRDAKLRAAMLAVGDDTVVVMDTILRGGDCCCFEALRRVPGGGGGWRADPLPNPPVGPLDLLRSGLARVDLHQRRQRHLLLGRRARDMEEGGRLGGSVP
jgi:hypothetical protein